MAEKQAEVFARKTVEVLRIAVETAKEEMHSEELTRKRDLQALEQGLKHDIHALELTIQSDMEKSRNSLLLWIFTMMTAFSSGLIAVVAKGFHWF
jgi:hypothetical protein